MIVADAVMMNARTATVFQHMNRIFNEINYTVTYVIGRFVTHNYRCRSSCIRLAAATASGSITLLTM